MVTDSRIVAAVWLVCATGMKHCGVVDADKENGADGHANLKKSFLESKDKISDIPMYQLFYRKCIGRCDNQSA